MGYVAIFDLGLPSAVCRFISQTIVGGVPAKVIKFREPQVSGFVKKAEEISRKGKV